MAYGRGGRGDGGRDGEISMRIAARTLLASALALVWLAGAAAAAANYPFGSHRQPYAEGVLRPPVSPKAADKATAAFYDRWKRLYLEPGCTAGDWRVKADTNTGAWVVSEGQGYGMVIVAMMAGHDPEARAIFDGLHRYNRAHPSRNDPDLVAWAQDEDCKNILNPDSATDGDLDIAYGLLLADMQWGSSGDIDYAAEAGRVIDAIERRNLTPETRILNLGDWVTADLKRYYYGTRSSDWMLGHFRAFGERPGRGVWKRALSAHQRLIATMQRRYAPNTGLLPDFVVDTQAEPRPAPKGYLEARTDGSYSWNACRTPWRIGVDAATSGDPRSRAAARKMSRWIRGKTGGDPTRILDGYTLSGSPMERGNDLAFIAPFAVAAMLDPDGQAWLDALWREIVSRPASDYYADSIKLMSMLALSRNWLTP